MDNVKILGIAPYEGLKNMMSNLAAQRKEIELTLYLGDWEDGVAIVRRENLLQYDIIISRGGTAEKIKEFSSIPVLEIPLSHYDILSAIKLAQNYKERFAIVGFPSISDFARMLCNILCYDIDIFTITGQKDLIQCIQELKQKGYSIILGDTMTTAYSKKAGLNAVLITSGSESICETFDRAVYFSQFHANVRKENDLLKSYFSAGNQILLAFTDEGKLLFDSFGNLQHHTLTASVSRMVPSVLKEGIRLESRTISGKSMWIYGKKAGYEGKTIVFFSITRSKSSGRLTGYGISSKQTQDISNQYADLFDYNTASAHLKETARSYAASASVILIAGEPGTGKNRMVDFIFTRSSTKNRFLYTIDCHELQSRTLFMLLKQPESPFYETGNTLYLRDIQHLEQDLINQLVTFICNTDFSRRNRVLISAAEERGERNLCGYLKKYLECPTLWLPPLRQHIQDIPSLINLYLNEINTATSKQTVGIEPEGISLLQGFHWNGNLSQFKRILTSLSALSDTPYIKTEDVKRILKEENRSSANHDENTDIRINSQQPLNDIIADIIHSVLSQKGMNQTKAAKQLGICRTTLWKYLKQ